MRITLNGEPMGAPEGVSVHALLAGLELHRAMVAVAINGAFVPRSQHETHVLQEGDAVELVAPMQGG